MDKLPKIYGFNHFSEAGDKYFIPSIFLSKCNFRCMYCMNAVLALSTAKNEIDFGAVERYVKEEKPEMIMISGGEPTCTKLNELIYLIKRIKDTGCNVGLSTNGSSPSKIKKIIKDLSFLSLDLKSPYEHDYRLISGQTNVLEKIKETYSILKNIPSKNLEYEVRITLFPTFFKDMEDAYEKIKEIITENETKIVFQQFRHTKVILDPMSLDVKPFSNDVILKYKKTFQAFYHNVSARWV